MFRSVGWPLLRAEGFFYNLDILLTRIGCLLACEHVSTLF
jgi:hypothetical protein